MAKRKVKVFSKVCSYMLIVLLIFGIGGGVAFMTNGFTTDFKTFYVSVNDEIYLDSNKNVKIAVDGETRFDVIYTFGIFNKTHNNEFSVKVIPNIKNDNNFDFSINKQLYSFGAEKDFTKCFDIEIFDNYFTLNLISTDMRFILSKLYGTSEILFFEDFKSCSYFTLVVSSFNGESQLLFDLPADMLIVFVAGVSFDKGGIEF